MKTITITDDQKNIILDSLRERIANLYRLADQYKGNKDAVMACLAEKRRVEKVLEYLKKL